MSDPANSSGREVTALVDTHVHLHSCFDEDEFFDGAADNLRRLGVEHGLERAPVGLLVLTSGADEPPFHRWLDAALERASSRSRWSLETTDEDESVQARLDGELRLILVAGRQLRTAENLEVLAVACSAELADGLGLVDTLGMVRAAGVPAVVPWGFGKWWFQRGRLLERVLENQDPADFFLGDNGGRPRAYPRSRLFAAAEGRGIHVLPGSDPLPFPHHARRAGSCGFLLREPICADRPAAGVRAVLRDPGFSPETYAARDDALGFVRNQISMQLRGRRPRAAS